jgi:hypothetical protein
LPEGKKYILNQLNDPSPNRTGFLLIAKHEHIEHGIQVRATATGLVLPLIELPYVGSNLLITTRKTVDEPK